MNDQNDFQILEDYCKQDGRRLRGEVDAILSRFGGIVQADRDDFYSLANETLARAWQGYDGTKDFHGFFHTCLENRIKSEITRRNRQKRRADREALSIDAPAGEDGSCLKDMLPSDFDIEKETGLFEGGGCSTDFSGTRASRFLDQLSAFQRRIVKMRLKGMSKKEIVRALGIRERAYEEQLSAIRSYDNVSILLEKEAPEKRREDMGEGTYMAVQTAEKSKETRYSVLSYLKRLEDFTIRRDHPLQRKASQWTKQQKDNLITSVLNEDPIPPVVLAEQLRPEGRDNWLIDGLQRLSNLAEYRSNGFRVGKNAERPVIAYQSVDREKDGTVKLDHGNPVYIKKEIDVRGKYYRDLPAEIRERFDDFTIPAVQYFNCSDDDIEYHIRRYNAARTMSAAQKGITYLGERYARRVKELARHPFLRDKSSFRPAEIVNGTADRVITESLMAIFFLEDWKKKHEDACQWLKEHGKDSQFDALEDMLDRLDRAVEEDVSPMFSSRDAFLWFALFDRFCRTGAEDEAFIRFMRAFQHSLHERSVGGRTYDQLCEKSTKDKKVVTAKLDIMESLMKDWLNHGGSSL